MLYTGIKGYLNKLIIYFKSWRVLLLLVLTLFMMMVDLSDSKLMNYNTLYLICTFVFSQSVSNKSKEMRMLCILPLNSRLRAIHLISEAIGVAVLLTLWRSGVYIIEILMKVCTLQKAARWFFGLDFIIILLISIFWRISVNKVRLEKSKIKRDTTILTISSILVFIQVILFFLDLGFVWLEVPFTVLAYFAVATIWYVMLLKIRDCTLDYEALIAKAVKK